MKVIKLAAEYDSYPLWSNSDGLNNIDPSLLPISKDLHDALLNWADIYDLTLNRSDPIMSGFKNSEEEENFYRVGKELSQKLMLELGNDFLIIYDGKK